MSFSADKCLKIDMPLGTVYMSTEACLVSVVDTAPSKNMRDDEIAIETAKMGNVTVVVAAMSIFCKKKCESRSDNPGNKKPSHQKVESATFLGGNSRKLRNISQKTRKGWISKKIST